MHVDRYTKAVLTLIALELGWIALTHTAPPVSAQAAATPVVITGINLTDRNRYLPVAIVGGVNPSTVGLEPVSVRVDTRQQPVRVEVQSPVDVRTVSPVRVEPGDRPLKIESPPIVFTARPGQ